MNAPSSPEPLDLSPEDRRARTARALRDAARARSARQRAELLGYVVRINMGLARSVARRYRHRGIESEDLCQVAYAALTRAARAFDPARDKDFTSYAVPTIRGELKKHFRDLGWVVRPPRRVQEIQAAVIRAEGELVQQAGRSPRPSEVAEHLGVDMGLVVEAMSADGCFAPASLDRLVPRGDTALALVDMMGVEDRSMALAEERLSLAPLLRALSERDRRILYMRFYEERTQQEIGECIGVTQMQVSRLLTRIMRDLRARLTEEGQHPVAS